MESRASVIIGGRSGTHSAMAPNLGCDKNIPEISTFDTHNTPDTGVQACREVTNLSWWVPSMERVGYLVGPPRYWAPNGTKQVHWLANASHLSLVVHAAIPTTTPQVQVAVYLFR